jgi:hypothetical protein
MLKRLLKILIAGGLAITLVSGVSADVIPTSTWTSFYGSASTYNGNPIPVGSIIDAYDTFLVHCGIDTVHTQGDYGFMQVYGDDGFGEGPELGEALTFYINGRLATPLGPDVAEWAGKCVREVNLSATAAVSMIQTALPVDQDCSPGEVVRYYATVRNTGEGLDFYSVSAVSQQGSIIEPMSGFSYALPGEEATIYFDVLIPYAIYVDMDDVVIFKVISGADATVFIEDTVVTHVLISTDVSDDDSRLLPGDFELYQNYPNPFNPTTIISFNLSAKTDVEMEIFDLLGRMVNHVELGNMNAGYHSIKYDAAGLSSGVYFYRIKAGVFNETRKMVLMK